MPPMRPPNVRACVEVSHRLTLEGHYGGVLIFLSSSVRAFVELVVCLAFPFMTSSVRLSFAAAHFSCGRISCSQSDQSGKPFFLQRSSRTGGTGRRGDAAADLCAAASVSNRPEKCKTQCASLSYLVLVYVGLLTQRYV